MNRIKFEFFKNVAEVTEAVFDGSDQVELHFPDAKGGYLSIGPRIIKVEDGVSVFSLSSFADGIQGCYLMIDGERFELPSLEKKDHLFRMVPSDERTRSAKVKYLKDLEKRVAALEADMTAAKEKIFGRKGII